ncbi:MAG: M3 family oligoendopeptidase, partial [Candidatus Binatia bacterium]
MITTDLAVAGVAWDLSALYRGPADAAIDADLAQALERAQAFAARYRGTIDVAGGPAPAWVAAALAEL